MVKHTVTAAEIAGRNLAVDLLAHLRDQWIEANMEEMPDDEIGEAMLREMKVEVMAGFFERAHRNGPDYERGFFQKLGVIVGSELEDWSDELFENNREPRRAVA